MIAFRESQKDGDAGLRRRRRPSRKPTGLARDPLTQSLRVEPKRATAARSLDVLADPWSSAAYGAGIGLVVLVGLLYILPAVWLIFGGTLDPLAARVLVATCLVAALGTGWATASRAKLGAAVTVGLVALAVPIVANAVIDTSFDGQFYHFQGVYALAGGWNPYYAPAAMPDDVVPWEPSIWVEHYPIASWLAKAVQFQAGLPFEATKGLGIVLAVASALLSFAFGRRLGLAARPAVGLSVLAAANPILLAQLFTRMNDGLLGAGLTILVVLLTWALVFRSRAAAFGIVPITIFTVNLKFSAVVIVCGFVAMAFLALAFRRGLAPAVRFAAAMAVLVGVGVFGIGYAPYGNNLVNHGHPFFPIMGPDETVDIIRTNLPDVYQDASPLGAFFRSLASETHSGFESRSELKLPFTLSRAELRASGGPDVRVAGFGPWFSAALVLAALQAALLLATTRRNRNVQWLLVAAVAIFAFSAVFPESWWARYVPELWLVPILLATAGYLAVARTPRILATVITLVLAIDAAMVFGVATYFGAQKTQAIRAQIETLRPWPGPIHVAFGVSQARIVLFREAGLDIRLTPPEAPCAARYPIAAYARGTIDGDVCPVAADPPPN